MNDNSFNSIEKLLELGMSMSIAQQMMQTMNHAMSNMQSPRFSNLNVPLPVQVQFYALVNEIPQGPFTEEEIKKYITEGKINSSTLMWKNGLPGWMSAAQLTEIASLFSNVPPPTAL